MNAYGSGFPDSYGKNMLLNMLLTTLRQFVVQTDGGLALTPRTAVANFPWTRALRKAEVRDRESRASQKASAARPTTRRVPLSGNRSRGYLALKRSLDLLGGLVLLALFGPLMTLVWCLLYVTTKGQPVFVQERVGQGGRRFRMFKFRTMRTDAEQLKHLVKNEQSGPVFKNRRDPRITRLGAVLRSTSIDELPQIFNVIRGEMSLVGPRPPVPSEVEQYRPWQLQRLAIQPGLTCLWQVSGRCEIGFEEWVRMDIRYAKRQGLWTDLSLLVRTPWSVLSRRGAY